MAEHAWHPKIHWERARAFADTEYGWVGIIKAFSLRKADGGWHLSCRLPDTKGLMSQSEYTSEAIAKDRADNLLASFWRDFRKSRPEGG